MAPWLSTLRAIWASGKIFCHLASLPRGWPRSTASERSGRGSPGAILAGWWVVESAAHAEITRVIDTEWTRIDLFSGDEVSVIALWLPSSFATRDRAPDLLPTWKKVRRGARCRGRRQRPRGVFTCVPSSL